MILVCAPSPFRVHSHCRHCAAAAPAATPTPGPRADDADAAAAQAAPSSSSPPRTATATSGRRGLCRRRRAVVVRLFSPPSNTTVRDDPSPSPSPALLLSSPLLSCVCVGSSPLAHSVLPNPLWPSGGGVTWRCHVVWCHWWCVRSVAAAASCAGSYTAFPPLCFFGIRCVPRRSVLAATSSTYCWVPV